MSDQDEKAWAEMFARHKKVKWDDRVPVDLLEVDGVKQPPGKKIYISRGVYDKIKEMSGGKEEG